MITQRIAIALRQQEWATILIEFLLVIFGVLIALELDQWKDARAYDAQDIQFLEFVDGSRLPIHVTTTVASAG